MTDKTADDDQARIEAEARSAILRWGYGRFADVLAAVAGESVGGPWTDRPAKPHAEMAAEYSRWIDFHHAGNGDYDDFLRRELVRS